MIKYLGSKKLLIPQLQVVVDREVPEAKTFLDLFSGTSRVGHAFKRKGLQVISNDLATYASVIARCYVEADVEDWKESASKIIAELQKLPGAPGYFTETFCEQSRFFHPKNGERVDAIRERILELSTPPELEAILLTSLIEAADRVDSTCGIQMAYLKEWAPRAHKDLELRLPDLLPRSKNGKGKVYQKDAALLAEELEVDVAYLDPPYNQHSYFGNYHIWETLCLWDKPEVYGKACKRMDCKTKKSMFNYKAEAHPAMKELMSAIHAKVIIVSMNDDGFFTRKEMEDILSHKGKVETVAFDYKRYVGAQIGVHNLRGEKVGTPTKLRNTEFFYVVIPNN